jgi:hypothetical protein
MQVTTHLTEDFGPLFYQLQNKYLSGEKKNELSRWWLDLIETEVEDYLKNYYNYQFDACPYNYLDQPPKSMEIVKHNLLLIRSILNLQTEHHGHFQQSIILPLKTSIYRKIDSFVVDSFTILCSLLNLTFYLYNSHKIELTEVLSAFEKQQPRFPASQQKQIQNLLEDIKYIDTMKKLELQVFAPKEDNKKAILDIVPVTGLIFNKLYRMENELNTCISHWSR